MLPLPIPLNKDRFYQFCDTYAGAVRIDDLPIPETSLQRADYFFNNRRVIAEVKSIETDPNRKLAQFIEDAGIRPPGPTAVLSEVVKGHADPKLEHKAFTKFTDSIARSMEEANSQIRDTKKLLRVEADGILIFIHGNLPNMTPDHMHTRILREMKKRTPEGGTKYDQLRWVIIVSEIHKLKTTDGKMLAAFITLGNDEVPDQFGCDVFVSELAERWAAFTGRTNRTIPASAIW